MPWKVKVKVASPFGYMSLNRRNGSDAYKWKVKVKLPVHLNGMELMNIKHSTVTKVKKLVETFEWILAKYVMESLNESG